MRLAPPATPRMRPDVRPTKLTRRSASPRGYVFKMMASVSRAGIRCRRADATSNAIPKPVRTARTRGTILLIIRANATQFFPAKNRHEPLNIFQHWSGSIASPNVRVLTRFHQLRTLLDSERGSVVVEGLHTVPV